MDRKITLDNSKNNIYDVVMMNKIKNGGGRGDEKGKENKTYCPGSV